MSSNCDSMGFPVVREGVRIEDLLSNELMMGNHKGADVDHLEAEPSGGLKPSRSGGIPILETVTVEDYYSSDEPISPKSTTDLCSNATSETVRAMLRTNRHEREELIKTRRKLADVLKFLKAQGFKEENVIDSLQSDGFGPKILSRNEFGLPITEKDTDEPSSDPVLKAKFVPEYESGDGENLSAGKESKERMGEGSNLNNNMTKEGTTEAPKSWANILRKDIPEVNFKYFPVEKGATTVDPPVEVLRMGNEKYKHCAVGTFSKGTQSFKNVSEFAFHNWKSRGLISVHQKDLRTYMFRFNDAAGVNEALSRGTWYVGRRPMIVTAWGHKPGSTVISSMPIWIKLSNLPDCYWTEEGLARIASVVGEPLRADAATSKLEILPFAKMQVKYKLGDPLPNEIQASVIDPITEERSIVKVIVTYPVRPLSCSGCHSLGHSVAACPSVTRVWQRKDINPRKPEEPTKTGKNDTGRVTMQENDTSPPMSPIKESEWTEVKRKKHSCQSDTDYSPSPLNTFKNLRQVDEVDGKIGQNNSKTQAEVHSPKRLTKTQKKKLNASLGSSSPSLS